MDALLSKAVRLLLSSEQGPGARGQGPGHSSDAAASVNARGQGGPGPGARGHTHSDASLGALRVAHPSLVGMIIKHLRRAREEMQSAPQAPRPFSVLPSVFTAASRHDDKPVNILYQPNVIRMLADQV